MTHAEAAPTSAATHWLIAPLARLGGAISALLILATFGVTIYAIAMRYLFNQPLLWADEVTGWALVAIVMLGAAEAHRRSDHIAIDLITSRATGARHTAIKVVAELATFAFAVVVGVSVWHSITFARAFGSYTSGEIILETWILQVPILVGCCLLALTAAARLVDEVLSARRP